MKKIFFLIPLFLSFSIIAFAKEDPDSIKLMQEFKQYKDSVNNAMHYETGAITLNGGMAKLNIPRGFKYLGVEQSNYVVTEVWGNPKNYDILGMIFPENGGPLVDDSYAFCHQL
ncbi:MAG: DUF2167 domain-containing protein [Chitinophagaceae bacterium]